MPILQQKDQLARAHNHCETLKARFSNVEVVECDLTESFTCFSTNLPSHVASNELVMANARARLRMTTLYAFAQANLSLVVGTGNKVEDFGVGFYTKYGDGGVDLSPIAGLKKTEVFALAKHLGVQEDILIAPPTDGLWQDDRSDEDQMGATYPELEWAMRYLEQPVSSDEILSDRQKEVLAIYTRMHKANRHKMEAIPVCIVKEVTSEY
jgi:NAD+ synthase